MISQGKEVSNSDDQEDYKKEGPDLQVPQFMLVSCQLSIVIPACPESKRGMIPDVAGMTIQIPRHYKVDLTL